MELRFIYIKLKIDNLCPLELVLNGFDETVREGKGENSESKGAVAGGVSVRVRKQSSHPGPAMWMHGTELPCAPTP